MRAWEYVLLGVVCLIAFSSLAQLMRLKRARLVAELQREAERKKQQTAAQQANSE